MKFFIKLTKTDIKYFLYVFLGVFSVSLFLKSCNSDPSKRIKSENLAAAEQRSSNNSSFPVMTFDFENYNYGEVVDGEIVEVDFNFTNTGKTDLIVFDASASCGCTVPKYPKNENIKPGDKGTIKVMFDTANKPGKQIKTVTLSTNTSTGKKLIRINGFVLNK
tara:strand:+ start:23 stop:511 length:489 start_codon:yes stop_codon:yes gene_type:complete